MAKGLWVKTSPTSTYSAVKNFFVKVSQASWVSVADAWVKVSPTLWSSFYSAATGPDSPIEILTSFNTSEELRLQGKNYHWTPTPSTLQYKFSVVNASTAATQDITAFTTTSNPSTGSYLTLPSSTTYQTVTAAGGYYYQGVNNIFRFTVKGTTASGAVVESKAEYTFRIPAAPTLSVTSINSTSVTLSITAASSDDYYATGRYIVYRYDTTSGTVYGTSGGTNGLGGITANANTVNTTLTGLVAGRNYIFYVLPVTGTSGYNLSTYTGYPGIQASINYTIDAGYSFAFGDNIYVSTNGYIGINGTASANGSDALPSTGEYLAVMSRDLQQSSATSIWYWSDTSQYVVRWEGYDYNTPASTKTYQVTFYNNQNYADVYVILKNGQDGSTTAHYKNGVIRSSYSAALTTGNMRRVYFDGTAPITITGLTEKSTSIMKQVTGLTSGTTDVGYTTLTTATNQVNFVAGTVSVSGGSTTTGNGYVTTGATLTVSTSGWPSGTTFTYQWKKTRNINGLPDINQGTASSQAVSTNGEYVYCTVSYSNTSAGASGSVNTYYYMVVPPAPTYTLTNNANGTFTISSVTASTAGYYYGTWGSSNTAIARTALATNTTVTSGAGTISVTLYSSANVTYSGDINPTQINSWESTTNSVSVTTITAQSTGQMRRVTMPVAFAASSQTVWVGTNGYVSTTVDPTTSPGTSWPTAGGVVIGPAVADLRQTSLSYKADSSNFYIRWQGCALSETAGSVTIDYLMKFTWSSTTVDVYFITNSTTATLSGDAIRYPAGTSYQTWANSSSITGMTIPTGMTSDSTNNNVDDNRTAITATKPALNLTTNPAYGTATSASSGWTASISTSPNPTGGTYSVVTQTAGSASVNSSTGALTASGLTSGQSSTVTVRYSLSGYNSVDITATGTATAAGSPPATPTGLTITSSGLASWNAVPGATSYTLNYWLASSSSGANAFQPAASPVNVGNVTSYQIPYATNPSTGIYCNYTDAAVLASNAYGSSSYSAWYPSASTYV